MEDLYKGINIKALEEIPEEIMNVAKATHELFSAFVHAGFSRSEAFYLTSEILKGGLKNG